MICRFCGGPVEPDDLLHALRCDGQQGKVEAEDLPMLASGLTPDTLATSTAAAVSVLDSKDTQRAQVEDTIKAAGLDGRSDDDVQTLLHLDGSSERPRRWELWKQGRIRVLRDSEGNAIRRLTRTQRRAVVWVHVDVLDRQERA